MNKGLLKTIAIIAIITLLLYTTAGYESVKYFGVIGCIVYLIMEKRGLYE